MPSRALRGQVKFLHWDNEGWCLQKSLSKKAQVPAWRGYHFKFSQLRRSIEKREREVSNGVDISISSCVHLRLKSYAYWAESKGVILTCS